MLLLDEVYVPLVILPHPLWPFAPRANGREGCARDTEGRARAVPQHVSGDTRFSCVRARRTWLQTPTTHPLAPVRPVIAGSPHARGPRISEYSDHTS
jgi:hypothetical protein